MKINLKSIFGRKPNSSVDKGGSEHDQHANFYYTNLINSILLFSLSTEELEKLASPVFDPIFELESEIDLAFIPLCFDTVFRNGLIDSSLKNELLAFKKETDEIPEAIWDWEFIDNHVVWIAVRKKANTLLDKLGVTSRTYNYNFTSVYDNDGNILTKGKTLVPIENMIEITTFDYDEEYEIRLKLQISSSDCSSSLIIYTEPNVFKEFASNLVDFPFNNLKTIIFEHGKDDNKWAYYCKLEVSLYNETGKVLVSSLMDNKANPKDHYRCMFPIYTDIPTINKLGKELLKWNPFPGEIWTFENTYIEDI